jgi:beta-lactamase superfamily II metal-dependent hydrolase
MALDEIILLDVGHGNCSIIRSGDNVVVVDAGHGATLWETLNQEGIDTINAVIVSHADRDHIAGVASLLTSEKIAVQAIYVNPDATKNKCGNSAWNMLRSAVEDARERKALKTKVGVDTDDPGAIEVGSILLEVMSPTPEFAMGGSGSSTPDGEQLLTSNTVSIVLRVHYDGVPLVLLAGDIDGVGLEKMLDEKAEALAKVLVFPHHGGKPGGSTSEDFTNILLEGSKPEMIFFSNGRHHHLNPRPEIVETIKAESSARIVCSQLSKLCSEECSDSFDHLHEVPAKGRSGKDCCGGSIRFDLTELLSGDFSSLGDHEAFVGKIESALCRRT